jgi:hypothetical protein
MFGDYVRNVYNTTELPLLASSTQERYSGIIANYLIPTFGSFCLRDMTSLTLQKYISGFQVQSREDGEPGGNSARQKLSRESIDKIGDVLSSALGSAVKYGYVASNSAAGLQVPPEKRGKRRHKPFVRPEGFAALVELISESYATMVYVAVYTGPSGQRIDRTAMG